jgi:hypothetical protein
VTESKLDILADKAQQTADTWAAEGGLKAKVAPELADDAAFLRKLKPSLMVARAKGEAPTNEKPGHGRVAPSGPQLNRKRSQGRKQPKDRRSPWLVIGVALVAGIALAKVIDWRGHAHPRD